MSSDLLPPPSGSDDLVEMVERLRILLIATATGSAGDDTDYKRIRKTLVAHPEVGPLLPRFIRTCSTLGEFWTYIKGEAGTYAERRDIVTQALRPALEILETGEATTTTAYERLEPPLGQGGFGVVWKYRHRQLDMFFAFKVFAPAFVGADSRNLDRFFREARILFQLQHPDIVRVYDVGMMGRRPFIRMDFCEGETLNATLRRTGHVGADAARRLVRRLAGALEHAHGVGVVHRDLKPSNIMIGPKEGPAEAQRIRLIDFGLGLFVEQDIVSRITPTGEGVAGGHYTPPELYSNPKLIDPRTDMYSLGAIWFEVLTGRPPVGASVAKALAGTRGLTSADRDLLLACLGDPEDRPTAKELASS